MAISVSYYDIWYMIIAYLLFLQVILLICVPLMSAHLELRVENKTDVKGQYIKLLNRGIVTVAASTSCKCAGVFAINCTSYLVCAAVNGGFIGAEATCPSQQNFNPCTKQCSSSYICKPSCTAAGFICPTSTTFTLCAAAGVAVVQNQACPSGYYCNQKCSSPCLSDISIC